MDLSCPGQGQHWLILTFVENDIRKRKLALKSDRLVGAKNFNFLKRISKIVQTYCQIHLLDLSCRG